MFLFTLSLVYLYMCPCFYLSYLLPLSTYLCVHVSIYLSIYFASMIFALKFAVCNISHNKAILVKARVRSMYVYSNHRMGGVDKIRGWSGGWGGGLKDTNKSVWILAIQFSVFKLLELFDDIYNYRLLIMDMLDNNHVSKLNLLTSQVF